MHFVPEDSAIIGEKGSGGYYEAASNSTTDMGGLAILVTLCTFTMPLRWPAVLAVAPVATR
eukprot:1342860-Amorphochlora_amoeboformis.AAC.2